MQTGVLEASPQRLGEGPRHQELKWIVSVAAMPDPKVRSYYIGEAAQPAENRMEVPVGNGPCGEDEFVAGPLTGQGGIVRAFAEFSLLPDLMHLARESTGLPLAPLWTDCLEEVGCSLDHVEEADRPNGRSVWRWMAEDAVNLSVRLGLLRLLSDGDFAVDAAGDAVASMADAPMEAQSEDEDGRLRSLLAGQVRRLYRGNRGIDVSSLLLEAASAMRRTKHVWAQHCPGLLLVEFDALVHEAERDRAGAERLLGELEMNRNLAMRPYDSPGLTSDPADNAVIHSDAVTDFYLFNLEYDAR